jgi:hypothetical protein
MSSSPESVKCVRDIRTIPPQAYRLASDGKKWFHDCRQRQQLAWLLATFADGDGTRITTGIETMVNSLGISRRTIFRLLDDLEALGFLRNLSLTGFKGTRRRVLNVAAILEAATRVPYTPVVPDTGRTDVPDTSDSCATYAETVVPDSATVVPDTRPLMAETGLCGTQPSLGQTENPTAQLPDRQPAKPASAAPENGANEKPAGRQVSCLGWVRSENQHQKHVGCNS